jgi:sugar lactone lactonase YvrE/transcriptional regulator with XRE-family HTH domain
MDVHDRDYFGTLLRHHRLAIGLTQEELAERTRLSARGISDLERGVTTHPRKDTLHLLIDALQLTAEERETLTSAARAARVAPALQVTSGSASGDDGNGDVVVTDRDLARSSQQRRAPRLPVISRQRASHRVVAIAASILILAVTATGGMIGHRLAHTSSDRSILPISGGTFHPWGLAQPSHTSSVVHLSNALRATVDRHGNIYVTEGSGLFYGDVPTNHVDIVKLSPSGKILARWGRFGSHRGELNQPAGVVVDPHGNLYVADRGNDRIQEFSPSGKVLAVWGSFGTAPGQFDLPTGITLDSHGNTYVTDYSNNRVQKLSPSGKVLAVWGRACEARPGQFCNPTDVAVGPSDRVYVADTGNYRIQTLTSSGQSLNSWSPPSNLGNGPFALAVNARGDIYLVNHDDSQISKYSASGVSLGTWHVGSSTASYGLHGLAIDPTGHLIAVAQDRLYRSSPDGRSTKPLTIATPLTPARFDHPSVLAVDRQGTVYVVTGSSENRLQKLSASGRPVREWGGRTFRLSGLYDLTGMVADARNNVYVSDVLSSHILKVSPSGKLLARWGREGQRPGQFETPYGLTTDHHRNIYVADAGNNRIQKLSPAGIPVGQWGQLGTEQGQFNAPRAVAVDAQGTMYVADTGNHRIQKLSPSGKSLAVWGPTLSDGSHLRDVTSVSVDPRGNVYAVDAPGDRVIELSPTGTVVARWGTKGVRPGQFRGPESVVVDRNNNVYVADTENNRIEKLSH